MYINHILAEAYQHYIMVILNISMHYSLHQVIYHYIKLILKLFFIRSSYSSSISSFYKVNFQYTIWSVLYYIELRHYIKLFNFIQVNLIYQVYEAHYVKPRHSTYISGFFKKIHDDLSSQIFITIYSCFNFLERLQNKRAKKLLNDCCRLVIIPFPSLAFLGVLLPGTSLRPCVAKP